MDEGKLMRLAEENLLLNRQKTLKEAAPDEAHNALAEAAMHLLAPQWKACADARSEKQQAFYLSAEYLIGRLVYNNLYCLGALDAVRAQFEKAGADFSEFEDIEDDAFGNGGLGRLAACFLDSAATLGVPLTGYGLRYRYGLFKQAFDAEGRQMEMPDDWSRLGDPWSVRRDDLAVIVPMKTGDVRAVPYDMPVVGYAAKTIGTLRLWETQSLCEIDFQLFNEQQYKQAAAKKNYAEDIVKFLYPNDTLRAGKLMRVKQQYVLCSASIQDLLRSYRTKYAHDYSHFAALHAVQLNDTHPVMAIPELIRLLTKDGVSFEDAFAIARETFAYTNHTVMQEALEKWDLSLLSAISPELVKIIRQIDARFCREMKALGREITPRLCVIEEKRVHMAHLAVYATHSTNGVAEIHTEILKDSVFRDWYELFPERFSNKTNGITQRRWLGLCNPELCALIAEKIGNGFLTDLDELKGLRSLIDDELCDRFLAVKREKKEQLARLIQKREGVSLSPDMIFDVQIKRLHEYKRQLMNAVSIMAIYQRMKKGELQDFTPTAFLFGAKAAPGYVRAKAIIRYVNQIARLVNADPETNARLRVMFVQNYNCSYAEAIIPAADVSEQISPAGTEASGTSNMKLMLNGAVTLGTYDGANIEIVREAGTENNYVFGATVEELNAIRDTYDPKAVYAQNETLRHALDTLVDGTFADPDGAFHELYTALLEGASWHKPDHYFLLRDFDSYLEAKLRVNRDYRDRRAFAKKCLMNVSNAGKFSSDRTIRDYAREIWKV